MSGAVAISMSTVVVASEEPLRWADVVAELLDDRPRRKRMGIACVQRAHRATLDRTFDGFWSAHLAACEDACASPPATSAETAPSSAT